MHIDEAPQICRRAALSLGGYAMISTLAARRLTALDRQRQVAITIDDGPSSGAGNDLEKFQAISTGIREAFVAEKVPAIMFINERQFHLPGQQEQRVRVLEEWIQAGLEVGNHTYSHKRLEKTELPVFFEDVVQGEAISRELLRQHQQTLTWFRYPYLSSEQGEKAAAVEAFLRERHYRIAPVTVDYKDYSFASAYSRYVRAGEKAKADELFGSVMRALEHAFEYSEKRSQELLGYELPQILLIHCNEMNSRTLPETLHRIRQRGYQFVSMEQAMQDAAYQTTGLPPGSLGGRFFSGIAEAKGG